MLSVLISLSLASVGIGAAATYLITQNNNKVVPKDKYMECLRELNNLIEVYRETQEGK